VQPPLTGPEAEKEFVTRVPPSLPIDGLWDAGISYAPEPVALEEGAVIDGSPGHAPLRPASSADAVAESHEDVPFDTADPLYRFRHGLRL
jgi:hypothetical protein